MTNDKNNAVAEDNTPADLNFENALEQLEALVSKMEKGIWDLRLSTIAAHLGMEAVGDRQKVLIFAQVSNRKQ